MTTTQTQHYNAKKYPLRIPFEITKTLFKNKKLIYELSKRELLEPYAGQILGSVWAFIHPLFLICVYVFIFGIVFRAKIGGTHEMPMDYTTYILSGIIPWLAFQANLGKTSVAIVANGNLVKQVVFPLEILPIKTILATLASQLFSFCVLFIYVFIKYHGFPLTYALLPILLILQIILSLGVGFFLASVSVYIKDMKDIVSLITVISMYFLPIVYLPNWVPHLFKPIIYINPFSYMIWVYQDVLYYGRIVHPYSWLVFVFISFITYIVGAYCFAALKQNFGDAL